MDRINKQSLFLNPRNRNLFRISLLVLASLASIVILILPIASRPSIAPLKVGDVSSQDIQAPYSLNYVSDILTNQSRFEAEKNVSPVYLPTDPGIARTQIENLRLTLNYISTIRADSYSSNAQKIEDLTKIDNSSLSTDSAKKIIALSDSQWQSLQQESLNVLEQVMRNSIRDDQVKDAQRNIGTYISYSVPEDQALLISQLVSPFIVANTLYSEELTQAARQEAGNAVAPVNRTYISGEIIVRRGQLITETTLEALQKFGLIRQQNKSQDTLAAISLVLTLSTMIALFFSRRKMPLLDDLKSLLVITIVFIVFLAGARFIVPNRAVVPYLFPIPAFGLMVASLFSMESGLILSLALSILSAYGLSNSLDLTLFYMLTGAFSILVLGKGRRTGNFFSAGLAVGAVGSAVIIAYRLPDALTDWVGITTLVGVSFLNGIATASITLLFQYLFAQLLGKTTALQLLELSRPDHPLLQFILSNAPGTYQHSLQVANLAEQAAEAIGADPLLTRVGTLYHDAGKAVNPGFFIENQLSNNLNPHDDLEPLASATTIIQHVTDGVQLATKYHLPPRLLDFILEHHGTLMTRYQYAKALEAANNDTNKVDVNLFRYPGPSPRSKETALLMLADGSEARARAEVPKDEEELRIIIKKVIDFCQQEGQLDQTSLTMRDLTTITDSFVNTLLNTYHPRIKYPELKKNKKDTTEELSNLSSN